MTRALAFLRESLALYLERRVLAVLFLGFASGLPLALTTSTLAIWLTESGVTLTAIGLFALVGTPYTFKFAWAPLIDRLSLPWLTRRLGRRRGWLIATQLALMAALVLLGQSDPAATPLLTAALALAVAFCSASQDIVIDAFRVELLEEDEQGAGAATIVLGYRIGMLVSGAGALALADLLPWPAVYAVMASFVAVGMATVLACPEPAAPPAAPPLPGEDRLARLARWLEEAVVAPFAEFLGRRGWLAILLFILLYKLGDAFAGVMSNPFYVAIGFSKTEIAGVTKLFGLAATLVGGLAGGVMVARIGILRSLVVAGILQAASNLMFAVQAAVGADLGLLAVTIGLENLTGGMGTAAFVAYLSGLCNVAYTATQYALLSSFMAFGRTVLSSSAGWIAEQVDWVAFFLITTAVALPGLLMLLMLMRMRETMMPAARPAAAGE